MCRTQREQSFFLISLFLIIFLIIIALFESFNEIEDSLYFSFIGLFKRVIHISLDGFKLGKLKNQLWQI